MKKTLLPLIALENSVVKHRSPGKGEKKRLSNESKKIIIL
jgi:hypothetical protein